MKIIINDLNEVLTFNLEGMYDAEKKLQKELPRMMSLITSKTLKSEIRKYTDGIQDNRTKLKRIFSYLLTGPFRRKNTVRHEMVADLISSCKSAYSPEIKDVLLATRLNILIQYKISEYVLALSLASILELNAVSDLLNDIIEWEQEASEALAKLATKLSVSASKK